jgi:hypothetical protein
MSASKGLSTATYRQSRHPHLLWLYPIKPSQSGSSRTRADAFRLDSSEEGSVKSVLRDRRKNLTSNIDEIECSSAIELVECVRALLLHERASEGVARSFEDRETRPRSWFPQRFDHEQLSDTKAASIAELQTVRSSALGTRGMRS